LDACDFEMKFIYVLAGWEGSAAGSALLTDTVHKGLLHIAPGKYYLTNAGYDLAHPFVASDYHLREWVQRSQKPQNAKELFNLRHMCNIIERVFRVVKKRFQILNTAPLYPVESQDMLVYILCVLHNLIEGLEDDDYFQQQYDQAQDSRAAKRTSRTLSGQEEDKSMVTLGSKIADDMWNDYSRINQHRR
jgi:hypothetical protein